jgi:SWIM zinc finger
LKLWTSSYQWIKSTKYIICIPNDSSKKYYIPARDLQSITQANLDKYKNNKWTTFNQFKKSFDIWCMEMENGSDWKTSKCNCPAFFKNYICKHAVGMAIRLKYCKPPAAKTVPIGEKRKRGRPAKAKPALLLQ